MVKPSLPNDYERMIPEYHKGGQIYGEHIARYRAVQQIVSGKKVLDIASGSGYGTALIAETAAHVTGVDVSEASIKYADAHYGRKNVSYIVGDGERIPCDDESFDVVVSFETIEHVKNYEVFIRECKRVLKPEGLLVLSTPNDLEFAEGNHFHLHEFKEDELTELVKKYFNNMKSYYQATWLSNIVGPKDLIIREWSHEVEVTQTAPIKPEQYLYFFFLCANRPIIETVEPLLVVGQHFSERQQVQKEAEHLRMTEEFERLKAELDGIKKGRAYKAARLLSGARKKISPHNKSLK